MYFLIIIFFTWKREYKFTFALKFRICICIFSFWTLIVKGMYYNQENKTTIKCWYNYMLCGLPNQLFLFLHRFGIPMCVFGYFVMFLGLQSRFLVFLYHICMYILLKSEYGNYVKAFLIKTKPLSCSLGHYRDF